MKSIVASIDNTKNIIIIVQKNLADIMIYLYQDREI